MRQSTKFQHIRARLSYSDLSILLGQFFRNPFHLDRSQSCVIELYHICLESRPIIGVSYSSILDFRYCVPFNDSQATGVENVDPISDFLTACKN